MFFHCLLLHLQFFSFWLFDGVLPQLSPCFHPKIFRKFRTLPYISIHYRIRQASPFEEIDEQQLFMEFMNKVSVCEYYGISREVYLSCPDSDKRDKTNKYY